MIVVAFIQSLAKITEYATEIDIVENLFFFIFTFKRLWQYSTNVAAVATKTIVK